MSEAVLVRTAHVGYLHAWAAQRELASLRRQRAIPDVVWLLEHPPVFTFGRHASREDLWLSNGELAALGATCHQVDRGGQMTWHGPGQTTGYVIADLRPRLGVRAFVSALGAAMADATGLPDATFDARAPGLYRGGRKLGSVGIRVSQGITTHGLALNRDPDLSWFAKMTACGAPGVVATSLAVEGAEAAREHVEDALAAALARHLGAEFVVDDGVTALVNGVAALVRSPR